MKKDNLFERIMYILWPVLYFMIAYQLIGALLTELLSLVSYSRSSVGDFVVTNHNDLIIVISGISMMIAIVPVLTRIRAEVSEAEKDAEICRWWQILIMTAAGVFISLLVNYLISFTGLLKIESYTSVAKQQFGGTFVYEIAIYGFLTPLMEELIFRGMVLNRLLKAMSPGKAVIICSVLFGVYHMNPVQIIYGFVMGLVISGCYAKYRDFKLPYIMHAAMNVAALLL